MKHFKIGALMLTTLLALTACEDEQEVARFDFTATVEQMTSENNNSKVYLVNEEWVYWEMNDMISIGSDQPAPVPVDGTAQGSAYLTGASGDFENYNGSFVSTLAANSKYFLGLHPYDQDNVITGTPGSSTFSAIQLKLKTVQSYRTVDDKGDFTFDRQVLPMVAWYGGTWDSEPYTPFKLDFRSLAGLVRLQFYNHTSTTANITSIEVTCADKQLSGFFNVRDYNTYEPYLQGTSSDAANKKITLSMPGAVTEPTPADGSLAFGVNALKSFYLVLPALANRTVTTPYTLTVKVNTDQGSFTKNVTVPVRRNGITYLQAIGITAWDATNSSVERGLVGNGTEERPFKIYTLADLTHLRECFNHPDGSGNVYINGQKVTADTWFRIMRSDIVLRNSTWTTGITNFIGHMTYYTNAARSTHGITNRSYVPLFNSIGTGGHVKGLAIVTDSLININTDAPVDTLHYSPLCHTNKGTIENCRNISPASLSDDNKRFYGKTGGVSTYAGICVENGGTIIGSDCGVARIMHNNSHFAGICRRNTGTIKGCILSSPASIAGSGGTRGGICLNNEGTVQDCYTDINYNNFTDAVNWGGIVYNNVAGASHIIKNCYVSANATLYANGTVGGIVHTNGGIVDYCYVETYALSGNNVGGIVANLTGGEVRNCFIDDPALFITLRNVGGAHYAGGIAATQSGGSIKNCYSLVKHFVVNSMDATGVYGTLVGQISGPLATIENCYAWEVDAATPQFYGVKSAGTLTHCYLLDGTQAEVTSISSVNNTTLGTLLDNLNNDRPANGNEWVRTSSADDCAPSLMAPTATKHRNRR